MKITHKIIDEEAKENSKHNTPDGIKHPQRSIWRLEK